MKLLIKPNLDKAGAAQCAEKVCLLVQEFGMIPLMEEQLFPHFSHCKGIHFGSPREIYPETDICIAIGGDGTILHAAKCMIPDIKPVLGINMGRLGFLATLERNQLQLLSKLSEGNYQLEQRMLLEIIYTSNGTDQTFLALNDAVVSKAEMAKIVDIQVCCGERLVGNYRADGIILATPTGTTAYALSAGGPIMDPSIDGISMTPICPHSLFSRTIVFSGDSVIQIRPLIPDQKLFVTIDGEEGGPFRYGDLLTVKRSTRQIPLINLTGNQFYEVLNNKLLRRAYE
ncbi:MAG: NAD(+)/NADH kinase [Candidatus Merdivicinus sp.]